MPVAFGTDLPGRRVEVRPKGLTSDGKYELVVDGEVVMEAKPKSGRVELSHDDLHVKATLAWHEQSIKWAEVTVGDNEPFPLDPEPGSRQAKLEAYADEHPKLYAARHVIGGIGKVVIPILGVGLAFNFLPSIPTPDISVPSVSLPFPEINLPDFPDLPDPPGWLVKILESTGLFIPVLIGIAVAIREYQRRKSNAEKKERVGKINRSGDQDETDSPR